MIDNHLSNYQPIIGLEVHVELETKSKMFCGCPADHFGKEPNTQTCPVCLALPGALPVPNKKAIEWTIELALALDCKINEDSFFERKNYFYPDLPKGYQISQNEKPFGYGGHLGNIRINNIHLEEDTGKLIHSGGETLVDFNRSGVPLVEIVTEPDFRSIEEVDNYLKKLQTIIRYLEISGADMEKGSMRLEPSISIKPITNNSNLQFPMPNDQLPQYRVELKNINSFRFVRKALEYEIERQQKEPHIQQTRGYDAAKNITFPQREKEEAHDYRYFPEPDIPPFLFTKDQILKIKAKIPELPDEKSQRFVKDYGITEYDANILCETKEVADDFEQKVAANKDFTPKEIANSIINRRPLSKGPTGQVDEKIIRKVLADNPKVVADYKAGKTQVLGFLMGQTIQLLPLANKLQIKSALEKLLL